MSKTRTRYCCEVSEAKLLHQILVSREGTKAVKLFRYKFFSVAIMLCMSYPFTQSQDILLVMIRPSSSASSARLLYSCRREKIENHSVPDEQRNSKKDVSLGIRARMDRGDHSREGSTHMKLKAFFRLVTFLA